MIIADTWSIQPFSSKKVIVEQLSVILSTLLLKMSGVNGSVVAKSCDLGKAGS